MLSQPLRFDMRWGMEDMPGILRVLPHDVLHQPRFQELDDTETYDPVAPFKLIIETAYVAELVFAVDDISFIDSAVWSRKSACWWLYAENCRPAWAILSAILIIQLEFCARLRAISSIRLLRLRAVRIAITIPMLPAPRAISNPKRWPERAASWLLGYQQLSGHRRIQWDFQPCRTRR